MSAGKIVTVFNFILPVGIGLGPERRVGLQFGVGVLRQVRHHGLLVHVGIYHFLGLDQLLSAKSEKEHTGKIAL